MVNAGDKAGSIAAQAQVSVKGRHQFAVVDIWGTIRIYPAARLITHETGLRVDAMIVYTC